MGRLVLYIAMSLDGYIADSNGGIDWLTPFNAAGEDFGFGSFIEGVGATIMGSSTYEKMREFAQEDESGSKPSFVFTRRELPSPSRAVSFVNGDLAPVIEAAKRAAQGKDVWLVGGGQMVSACAGDGLIEQSRIFVMPLLLGGGVPLFPQNGKQCAMKLKSARQYDSGVVELHYEK